MSEAFVETLKRDVVRVNPLPDAETVLSLTGAWIEDYNENHPHSGLQWKSPREFIRAKTETASVSGETGDGALSLRMRGEPPLAFQPKTHNNYGNGGRSSHRDPGAKTA